ncbi:transglycosylase SLT domain-containing protein [Synechococcus sp. MU1643]|uniref:lytic transglycosylase domain-containing protein n=1 Tax=Synechococcus sp. MU1643 TaxID=2508349 RepID=UPI001CF7F603|nr:transglycosylase SLT domain-containing protein [Synechococcus sp. MU1643]MCB4427397.1 transglycosylase SLT domain-containing protein [Synechococcus sp. MU1643]
MRSRNVLVVSAITASLLTGLLLKPKQPQAEAEAVVPKPVVMAPVLLPAQASQPTTKGGRQYPLVPAESAELAALLVAVEQALRDPATPAEALPDLGHQQQVIYRVLSTDEPRSQQVVKALPPRWRSVAERHLAARREFVRMSRGRGPTMLPAWRIIQPEPAADLLSYYRKAEAATRIEWEVLAAVNLVETGMGRIDGISVANAQGPMQFLPTTWAEPGIGAGDIRDPNDAIQAAARYLVRRGGLQDIRRGLWGYNNSDYYGRAVLLYASLMKEDPTAYTGLYHWEIHFNAADGDLWLPVGYNQPQRISVEKHLQDNPASRSPNR